MQKIFFNSIIDGCLSMILEKNILAPKVQALLEDMPIEFYEKAKELIKKGDDNPDLRFDEGFYLEVEDYNFTWEFSYDEDFSITKAESNDSGIWASIMIYNPDTILEEILEVEDRDDDAPFANYEETLETKVLDNETTIVLGEEFEFSVKKGKFGTYNIVIEAGIPNDLIKNLTNKDLKYNINLKDHFSKEELKKTKESNDMEL